MRRLVYYVYDGIPRVVCWSKVKLHEHNKEESLQQLAKVEDESVIKNIVELIKEVEHPADNAAIVIIGKSNQIAILVDISC